MIARNSDYLWARVGRRCVRERRAVATHTHKHTHMRAQGGREGGREKKEECVEGRAAQQSRTPNIRNGDAARGKGEKRGDVGV